MNPAVIKIQKVSKKYTIGVLRHDTLRDRLTYLAKYGFSSNIAAGSATTLWALKDISFEIKQADIVGLIGRNGAGKSTLLKILSRITEPTTGRIEIIGRIGSLLEVGTGFHPELTGRENIFLNGAILGMSRKEINRKFDEIIDFAEIEKFIETPVKRYSSGMYVRLVFAVAAHLEPEILLVDEVLAVGDAAFQRKCLGKMSTIAGEGRTVVFVSHNMSAIQTLCTRGIYLDEGKVELDGDISRVVSYYLSSLEQSAAAPLIERRDRTGKGNIRLSKIEITSPGEWESNTLSTGRPALIKFGITQAKPGVNCHFTIYNQIGQPITTFKSWIVGPEDVRNAKTGTEVSCTIDELLLIPGQYRIDVAIYANSELEDHIESAAIFQVEQGQVRGRPLPEESSFGNVAMPHSWIIP